MSEESDRQAMVDRFEFFAAILLGLAAICTALSSFQAGLWDGKQAEAYGKANTEATASAAERAKAIVEMSKDAQIEITAYQLIEEGLNNVTSNPSVSVSSFEIATYLYTRQISDAGYKALGLPPEAKKDDGEDEEKTEALKGDILDTASDKDLVGNAEYQKEMLAKANELNAQSEKTFKEGNEANTIGDSFELANVMFAVSMFFMGIALVFKTEIKWKVLIAGGVMLVVPFIYILTLKWTF